MLAFKIKRWKLEEGERRRVKDILIKKERSIEPQHKRICIVSFFITYKLHIPALNSQLYNINLSCQIENNSADRIFRLPRTILRRQRRPE
jgi:hypothetical protein